MRRGLNIDHPVPEHGAYNHRGDWDIDAVIDRPHPDEQQVVREIDEDTGDPDPSIEEVLGNLPAAPEDAVEDVDESLFESGNQGTSNTRNSNMADSSVMTPKRGASGAGGGPGAKRGLFETASSSGTKLPGTAADQGGNGLGEDAVRPFKLPKPIVSIQNNVQYFRKVHRFYTYGVAYKIFAPTAPNEMAFMSTPLALIPWDWLHLYVNPSEFALLPNQASVKHVKCTVYQRNVRTAFQTNATATALATLNQNKNIIYSVGLNKKADTQPMKFPSFGAGETSMIPTGVNPWVQSDFVDDMNNWYGSTTNVSTVTPRHQTGQPDKLQYYAALIYRTSGTPHDGWECIQNYVEEYDADATAGGELVSVNYSPKIGICKPPKQLIQRRFGNTRNIIPRGSHALRNHNTTVDTFNTGVITTYNDEIAGIDQVWNSLQSPVQMIEKSQTHTEGLFLHESPEAQPTLHVGVQPVYAFTANDKAVNEKFQDTQAMFEVVAEAWIDTNSSTFRPLTLQSNVKMGNDWRHITGDINYGTGCLNGLYTRPAGLP